MKRVYLLRHAKAVRSDPMFNDFDRPLAPRGVRNAQAMGEAMAARAIHPTLVLCSPARRTVETWQQVALSLDEPVLEMDSTLYEASANDLMLRLRAVPKGVETVLLVGHNPGLQGLAIGLAAPGGAAPGLALQRLYEKYPTGALAGLAVPEADWSRLDWRTCPLDLFLRPGDL